MPDRLPVASVRSRWRYYATAPPAVILATLATLQIPEVAARAPFVMFIALVAVTAVYGGLGPALLVVALSEPAVALVLGADEPVRLGAFALLGGLLGVLGELRLRSERAERARREWSEVTLASIGDAVIVTDAESRVLSMNVSAERATGWSRDEAQRRPLREVFGIEDDRTGERAPDPVEQVRRERRVVGPVSDRVLVKRDGVRLPIEESGAPIWSEDGRVVGAVIVFRDISDRKEAERLQTELLENERLAKQEAEAANRAKDTFLAVLSHELRSPLNAIIGWSQLLREGDLAAADLARGLEVIDRNARLQTRLIDDVLDVSRIISGKLRVEFKTVDLRQIVATVVERARPALTEKRFELEVRGDCGGRVLGDAQRLDQIVGNLLSNAIKFTPPGGRIEIAMQRAGPRCELAVSDSGRGIAAEFLPHVFDAFRQEDAASTRRYGGLGLGLAIVRHLTEMHGGSVEVKSLGVDKGTTVVVQLPLAGAEGLVEEPRAGSAPLRESADLRGIRVLAVDDDSDSREIVASILTRAGAEVRAVASAADATRALEEWRPEVLISDLEMPEVDGWALIQSLRSRDHDLPAIALSAYAGAPERTRALEAGFDLHLAKPVDAGDLQRLVAHAVLRRRAAEG